MLVRDVEFVVLRMKEWLRSLKAEVFFIGLRFKVFFKNDSILGDICKIRERDVKYLIMYLLW